MTAPPRRFDANARVRALSEAVEFTLAASTEIHLMGHLRIVVNGADVTAQIKYRKGIALLALLAVECDILHPRERIADLFWPDHSAKAARSNLRQVLSNLARILGTAGNEQPALRTTPREVGLFPDARMDIDVVRLFNRRHARQQASVDILHNSSEIPPHAFLSGFELSECREFSDWLAQQRRYFADGIITVHEDLSATALAAGQLDLAIEHALQIEKIDPLLELNQVRLMRLLATSGRLNRAVRQYETFTERLREELDVEPEPSTQALYEQILQHQYLSSSSHVYHGVPPTRTSVLYVTSDASEAQADERARQMLSSRARMMKILRDHGGKVVESPGLGVFAYFPSMNKASEGSRMALDAARAVMARTLPSSSVRIGIYTNIDGDARAATQTEAMSLEETAELATRLSLIAEAGDIVLCNNTLLDQPDKAESLGEWHFRGLRRPVQVNRLTTG